MSLSRVEVVFLFWSLFPVFSRMQTFAYLFYSQRDFIGRLHVTSRISRQKKWMTKSSNLCWRGIGRTPTFGVILKTNEKLIKIWNELLLVGFSERNKFDQKQFG